jgi:hypothetical protein
MRSTETGSEPRSPSSIEELIISRAMSLRQLTFLEPYGLAMRMFVRLVLRDARKKHLREPIGPLLEQTVSKVNSEFGFFCDPLDANLRALCLYTVMVSRWHPGCKWRDPIDRKNGEHRHGT